MAKLDQFDGDFVRAEMVKAFLTSIEYRSRFTQSDALAEAYFEFDVPPRPETLIFKLNDPARIAEARTLIGKNKIVIGRVVKESIYYNRQRRYHLEPDLIGFADFSIELCDTGLQLDDALDHIGGSFLPGNIICPWGSRILREVPPQPR